VSVSGKAGTNTTDGPYLDMTGSISNLVIVPSFLEVSNAQVTMNLKPAKGFANIVASGSFNILGTPSTVSLNMQMSNYQLQSLTASLQTRRTIASIVTIDGTFNIAYSKGAVPTLDFNAVTSVAGYAIGTATGRIGPNDATIVGTVGVTGVFTAQVSGSFVWKAATGVNIINRAGQSVVAAAGDFRIAATNIPMILGGFPGTGNVTITRSQSVTAADFSASWSMGVGDIGGQVSVSGSFDSTGDFTFTGSGNLTLVAFNSAVTVSGSKKGSAWAFNMSSTMKVMGAVDVGFSGSFYSSGGATRFTMTGSANLSAAGIGGVGGATGSFTISNEPGKVGLAIAFSVKVMATTASGSMWIAADGTYSASLAMTLSLAGVSVGGQLKISRAFTAKRVCVSSCSSWSAKYRTDYVLPIVNTFVLGATLSYKSVSYSASLPIQLDGSFSYSISSGDQSWSKDIDIGDEWCVNYYVGKKCVDFTIAETDISAKFWSALLLKSSSPYIELSAGGSSKVEARTRKCSYDGCNGWTSWKTLASCGVSFSTAGKFSINCYGYKYTLN
jgi:hypothetical protein